MYFVLSWKILPARRYASAGISFRRVFVSVGVCVRVSARVCVSHTSIAAKRLHESSWFFAHTCGIQPTTIADTRRPALYTARLSIGREGASSRELIHQYVRRTTHFPTIALILLQCTVHWSERQNGRSDLHQILRRCHNMSDWNLLDDLIAFARWRHIARSLCRFQQPSCSDHGCQIRSFKALMQGRRNEKNGGGWRGLRVKPASR